MSDRPTKPFVGSAAAWRAASVASWCLHVPPTTGRPTPGPRSTVAASNGAGSNAYVSSPERWSPWYVHGCVSAPTSRIRPVVPAPQAARSPADDGADEDADDGGGAVFGCPSSSPVVSAYATSATTSTTMAVMPAIHRLAGETRQPGPVGTATEPPSAVPIRTCGPFSARCQRPPTWSARRAAVAASVTAASLGA